jgi:hypothetical protein
MRVQFTAKAQTQLEARKRWWRSHRDKAPELFDDEFAAATARIAAVPASFSVYARRPGHVIRRCLMPKTGRHLYFEIFRSTGEVWVIAAGGGQRLRPPRFRFQEAR